MVQAFAGKVAGFMDFVTEHAVGVFGLIAAIDDAAEVAGDFVVIEPFAAAGQKVSDTVSHCVFVAADKKKDIGRHGRKGKAEGKQYRK
jgi:hypothetical protein